MNSCLSEPNYKISNWKYLFAMKWSSLTLGAGKFVGTKFVKL
jgi:hypothetical protein